MILRRAPWGFHIVRWKDGLRLQVNPTTPTFLSDVEAAPDTKPVVYSPVPTIRTAGGAMASARVKSVVVRTLLWKSHVNVLVLDDKDRSVDVCEAADKSQEDYEKNCRKAQYMMDNCSLQWKEGRPKRRLQQRTVAIR